MNSKAPEGVDSSKLAERIDAKKFAIFVVTVLCAMAASSYLATSILIRNAFVEVQADYVAEVEARVQGNIDFYLRAHLASLADHARLPGLVNSVMNSTRNNAVSMDRLKRLQLLGIEARFSTFDIEGELIAQSDSQSKLFKRQPWLVDIANGEVAQRAEIFVDAQTTELFLRYTVPILYNGLPEGALVAEQIVDTQSLLSNISQDEKKYLVEFWGDHGLLGKLGTGRTSAQGRVILIPHLTNQVVSHVNSHSIDNDLYELLLINVGVTVVLVGLFLWFFKHIGQGLFVLPMQQLALAQQAATKTNERLKIANDELSQFAYRSSHDLRAPLATVLGLTGFAISDLQSGDVKETEDNLRKINQHVAKLDRLVGDILEMSRADLVDVHSSEVDVVAICNKLNKSLTAEGVEEVQFRYDCVLDKPFFSQETRITQVLENLLSNAVKYRNTEQDQCYVLVQVATVDENIVLKIKDNGIGIPVERFKEVFSMFKRFHPNVALGSGLGMSIVKKHVDRLNGTISFESSEAGTSINMTFPPVS